MIACLQNQANLLKSHSLIDLVFTKHLLHETCCHMQPGIVYTLLNETDVVPHLMELID